MEMYSTCTLVIHFWEYTVGGITLSLALDPTTTQYNRCKHAQTSHVPLYDNCGLKTEFEAPAVW